MIRQFVRCKTTFPSFAISELLLTLIAMSFHRSVNFALCWVSTASLVATSVPAARRLLSLSSLPQIAQNGEPFGLLLEGDRVKTVGSLFFSAASLIDQPFVYCICRSTFGGTPHCDVQMWF